MRTTGLGFPQQWFTVLERYHPTTCTISDLIVGNAYSFRVFSENLCGLSTSAAVTKELARIQKAGASGPGDQTPSQAWLRGSAFPGCISGPPRWLLVDAASRGVCCPLRTPNTAPHALAHSLQRL